MKPTIKNIIFDLGGVLIDWNPRYLYKKIFSNDAEMEYFLTHVCNDEWNVTQDAGRSLAEGTKILCAKFPDKAHLIKLFYDRWHEMLGGEIPESVAIFNRLKNNKMNLYALTNWSHETFAYARGHFKFLHDFLDIVVSGEEKIIKPDQRIYEILLQRNNLIAEECVFVDDRMVNVEPAKKLGMTVIQFISPAQLEQQLKNLDLL
jgi:2-haloacid dehalogenase